jgi:hypothetical protein
MSHLHPGSKPSTDAVKTQPERETYGGHTFNFSIALSHLKQGFKVARTGWNGKGMWLYLVPGSTFQVSEGRPLAAHLSVGETVTYLPHIDMKTATGEHVPWFASQTDLLAEDWQIVD